MFLIEVIRNGKRILFGTAPDASAAAASLDLALAKFEYVEVEDSAGNKFDREALVKLSAKLGIDAN